MNFIIAFLLIIAFENKQSIPDNYFSDKDAAIAYATANECPIMMVFGGSDWCKPCKKLKVEILDNLDFQEKTLGKIAILYLDFPAKKKNQLSEKQKKHNEELAAKFNQSGSFPKIILADKELKKIDEISYTGQSVEDFINKIIKQ